MIPTRRIALLAGLSLMPLPAFAQGRGNDQGNQGNGRGQGGNSQGGRRGNQDGNSQGGGGQWGRGGPPPRMGTIELNTVQGWLGVNPGFVAQPLPPGMYNRLAQGKPLPPGIARRAVPPGLMAGLPVYPGYEYAMVGTSLVLLAVGSGIVSAILSDAFRR